MLKKYLKIYLHFFKMNVLRRMAYRANFFMMIMSVALHLIIYIFFISIIYGHVRIIAGWDMYHALLIIASAMIIEGLCWVTFEMMNQMRYDVNNGNMDCYIVKPIDTQFLASVSQLDPEDLSRFFVAVVIFLYAIKNVDIFLGNAAVYLFLMVNAFIIAYSVITMVSTISFWVVETRTLNMIPFRIMQISQYPTDIYTGAMKMIFSFIIPIAFIATVPAKVLSGWYDWTLVVESFIIAGIFFCLSRKFFLFGLRHYSSASS